MKLKNEIKEWLFEMYIGYSLVGFNENIQDYIDPLISMCDGWEEYWSFSFDESKTKQYQTLRANTKNK